MYFGLSLLLLSAYLASAFAVSQSICHNDIYGVLVPLISNHAPAQTWCSSRYPLSAVTSTVKAADRRELLGRALLTTSTASTSEANVLPLTTQGPGAGRYCRAITTTSKQLDREAAWSSLVAKGGSVLAQICTCIETPKTVWVPSSTTTTSSKKTPVSTSQASSTTSKSGSAPTSSSISTTTGSSMSSTSSSQTTTVSSLSSTSGAATTTSRLTTTTSASTRTTTSVSTTTTSASTTTTTTSALTSSSNTITTTTTSSAPQTSITDDVPFQVALTIDSPLGKRATVYVGVSNGQLVIVDTQSQSTSFAVNNGALRIAGQTSAVGHADSSGSLPLTVYATRNDLPVQVTWTIGSGNKLVLSSGSLCTMNNILYANVGSYSTYSQACQYVTAQADASGLSITTTTQITGKQTTSGGGYVSIPKTSTSVPTPTCTKPAASLLVQNPSFESGDLAPWAFTGVGSNAKVSSGTYVAHAGSKVALINQVSNNGVTFKQDFDLSCVPAGTQMSVTVWYKPLSLDMIPEVGYLFCGMTAFWDYPRSTPNINYGNNKVTADDDGNYPWYSQTQTGTSPQQLVSLAVNFNCPGQFLLDDIQVTYT